MGGLLDLDHSIARNLNATVTPQTYLLDPKNRVVFSGMPDDSLGKGEVSTQTDPAKTYLGRALAEALAGKKISQPKGGGRVIGCYIDR